MYSAGTAYLQIVPSFRGIDRQLARIASDIGRQVDSSVGNAVRDALPNSIARAANSRAGGGKFTTTFSRMVNDALSNIEEVPLGTSEAQAKLAELRAELDDLSKKRIGVDLTDAEAVEKIRLLRAQLSDLARKSPDIQVRADAASAARKLGEILVLADRVDGRRVDVRVNTSGSDSAALSMRELAGTFGLTAGQMQALIFLGPAIGAAIVPAALAAAAAVATIGTAAVAAVGVAALGFSGIGTAVKALHKSQQDAAKSASSLTGSQDTLARSLDGVNSAEASLANTREQVAYAATQAAQQVADAQLAVAGAQREAAKAQGALTVAVEAAKRAQQDQAFDLRSNAIAQRQAVLDLADAKDKLDKLLANPRATQAEQEQARVTYEQRSLQLEQLGVQQQRLQADQEEATKKGIEGSDQVQAAQDRIRQTTEAVAKAQESLTNAIQAQQQQQRQGAYQIAQAQQAVVNAQRSLQDATVKSGVAGGAAMDGLRKAMDNLSPAGRDFALFLYGLKPELDRLRAASADGLLPGVQKGIEELLPLLPAITDWVGRYAKALGDLATDAGRTLASPYWQNFGNTLARTVIPTMKTTYETAKNFALGFGEITKQLLPLGENVGQGLLNFSREFAAWATRIGSNKTFQGLLEYVRREGPEVAATLKEMVDAVVHLAQAFEPIGGVTITTLRLLSTVINAIPVSVLTLLAGAMYAVAVQSRLMGAAKAIWFSAFGVQFAQMMVNAKIAMEVAADEGAGKLGRAMGGIKGAAGTLKEGITTAVSSIGPGSALMVAVAAAAVVISDYQKHQNEIAERAGNMKSALGQIAQAYKDGGDAAVYNLARTDSAVRQVSLALAKYGASSKVIADADQGNAHAQDIVIKALQSRESQLNTLLDKEKEHNTWIGFFTGSNKKYANSLGDSSTNLVDEIVAIHKLIPELQTQYEQQKAIDAAYKDAKQSGALWRGELDTVNTTLTGSNLSAKEYSQGLQAISDMSTAAGKGVQDYAKDVGYTIDKSAAYAAMVDKIAKSNLDASEKASLFGEALKDVGSATDLHGAQFDSLSSMFNNIATSAINATDKATLLKQGLDQLYGASISQNEADETLVRSQDSLSTQLSTNSAGFDLATAKMSENRQAILDNRDALEAALQAARDKYVADIAAGESEDLARQRHDDTVKSIENGIPVAQRQTTAVQDLVNEYGAIPPNVATNVTSPGLNEAIGKLIEARAVQMGFEANPRWDRRRIQDEVDFLRVDMGLDSPTILFGGRHAEGGRILGASPSKTADDKLAWVTSGEWVHPVDAVDYYGDNVMQAMQQRRIPRQLFAGGYATGGRVAPWNIELTGKPNPPIDLNKLWKKWEDAGRIQAALAGVGSVLRWTGVVEQVLQALGQPQSLLGAVLRRIQFESGGSPDIVNTTDSNWFAGHPSVGLAQVINSTFQAYSGQYRNVGPFRYGVSTDPFANVYAGMNYALHQYGSIQAIDPQVRPYGYDAGGFLPPGYSAVFNGTGKPEPVLTDDQWRAINTNTKGGDGATNNYNFQFRDTTLDESKLRAIQDRQAALARVGRAR